MPLKSLPLRSSRAWVRVSGALQLPVLVLTLWSTGTRAAFAGAGGTPNVIIFLMDDFGLTDVQEHPVYFPDGSPLYETPNMHRLAGEGMRFRNAYAQPLCSASRFSLLSGQYSAARYSLWAAITAGSDPAPTLPASSSSTRAYNFPSSRDHMPLEIETIAERLKAAGYATWHAGKWHLSPHENGTNPDPITNFYPVAQGFDKQLSVGGAGPRPGYFGPFTMPEMNDHNGDPAPGTNGTYIAEHMAGLVQGLIGDHLTNNPAQPFFLYYPTYSIHGPHESKKSVFNKYAAKLASLPDSKHRHPLLAAQVEGVDTELGALLDYMDSSGLAANTLFIFLADNGGLSFKSTSGTIYDDIGPDGIPDSPGGSSDGTYIGTTAPVDPATPLTNMEPRKGGKASIYEGGLRVPMIVRYPDGSVAGDAVSYEPAHLVDIYQTILDYTPATPKAGYTLDGVSLKPVLEQTGSLPDRDLFHYFPNSSTTYEKQPAGAAVLDYPHKLIATYSTAHDAVTIDYMLYRLDTDEGESNNIAGLFPDIVDSMRQKLENFYADTGAFVPTPNPSYNGTSYDSPEVTIDNYLADAGLTLLTPETFEIADPDDDNRNNRQEFLEQTAPDTSDTTVATIWLSDGELRFALPANSDQSAYSILDSTGAVAFTVSALELDGQYGPFFVYKPTGPVPSPDPADYTITVADTPLPKSTAYLTVDYRALLNGTQSARTDTIQLGNNLLVDTGSGLGVIQDAEVTTTGVSGDIRNGGPHGLAVVGGANDVWFDSGESIDLAIALQTTDGTPVTALQLEIVDVGSRAADGEVMTFSNPGVLGTASWPAGTGTNGTPGTLAGTLQFASDQTLTIQTGPLVATDQRTQLSYVTFRISDPGIDNTDRDGDLLPDAYETANGLNPADPADGNTDSDGDGRTRGQEYAAGTSDFDGADLFTLRIHSQDDGPDGMESVLAFDLKDKRAYRLYKGSQLDDFALLEDFGVISGDHDDVQLWDPIVTEREFYMLEAYLP